MRIAFAFWGVILLLCILYFKLSIGGFILSLVLSAIGLAIFSTMYLNKEEKKLNAFLDKELSRGNGFKTSQKYVDTVSEAGIAVDEDAKNICFFQKKDDRLKAHFYAYHQIIECELTEDGNTISKTSRASQLGCALVGGLVAGGVGAIVGGLSGSKKNLNNLIILK